MINMRNYVLTAALAAACAIGVQAQTPPAGQQPSPTTQPPSTTQPASPSDRQTSQAATTTLTGCVYREQDVPGRSPNVAERAGVLEDYILANVETSSSAGSSTSPSSTAGTAGTTGTAASGKMYKLEQIPDERLKAMVGKRVEVTGRIDAEAGDSKPAGTTGGAAADRSAGPDKVNLPEFEVTSIKEVSGSCPASPSSQK
jgi:hypothetical protein